MTALDIDYCLYILMFILVRLVILVILVRTRRFSSDAYHVSFE
jgi:hypothetical protein